jgi:THO complex subunit 2
MELLMSTWHVLAYVWLQVEQYSNQIDPVVEALRYLTPLGYDALTYIILTRLNMERSKARSSPASLLLQVMPPA